MGLHEGAPSVTIDDQAQENSEYVRKLLKKKQPDFTAVLELATVLEVLERELPCPACLRLQENKV